MARIGNETKLILKLAQERVANGRVAAVKKSSRAVEDERNNEEQRRYYAGYFEGVATGMADTLLILDTIVSEIEGS